MHYCQYVASLPIDSQDPNKYYHDFEYGFELLGDQELFERLIWEINQAGLSWSTILKKRESFFKAYDGFNIQKVASYNQDKIDQLLQDKGIIRNKLKINAAVYNAKQILEIQKEHGSFKIWLDRHKGYDLPSWVKLFKTHFKFVGPLIVSEFLMSTAYLPGAHMDCCPIKSDAQPIQK